jgi:Zn-dependent protease
MQNLVTVLWLLGFVMSIVLHEVAHGLAARAAGDYTAQKAGRLSLNPIRHIDPFMSIALPALMYITSGGRYMFGGAKPVPVNPYNYRNLEIDDLKVSLAGVATNFLIAAGLGYTLHFWEPETVGYALFGRLAMTNVILGTFNLMPIPPLDGSHVMRFLLARIDPGIAAAYERIGMLGIAFVFLLGGFIHAPLVWMLRFFWYNVLFLHGQMWNVY